MLEYSSLGLQVIYYLIIGSVTNDWTLIKKNFRFKDNFFK